MRLASVVKTTLVASCVFWSGAACGPGEPSIGREEPFTLRLTAVPDPVRVTTYSPGHGYRELQARWSLIVEETHGKAWMVQRVDVKVLDSTSGMTPPGKLGYDPLYSPLPEAPGRREFGLLWSLAISSFCAPPMPVCQGTFIDPPGRLRFVATVEVVDDKGEVHEGTLELMEAPGSR